jgi:hypothetical protein
VDAGHPLTLFKILDPDGRESKETQARRIHLQHKDNIAELLELVSLCKSVPASDTLQAPAPALPSDYEAKRFEEVKQDEDKNSKGTPVDQDIQENVEDFLYRRFDDVSLHKPFKWIGQTIKVKTDKRLCYNLENLDTTRRP